VFHGCAAGLMFGRAGEEEFSDAIVQREDVVALRRKVQATVDDRIREESADVTAHLNNGETIHLFVEHAIGSLQRPMTDANLEAKLTHLSAPVLGDARTRPLIDACWQLGHADNVHSLVSAMRV